MVDYLDVLAASAAAFAVGALWYGPIFGRRWRLLMEFSEGHMGAGESAATGQGMPMGAAMTGGFIATLVLVLALSFFMDALSVMSVNAALTVALVVSLGFIATTMANSVFYERRSWSLYVINAGHYVVAIIVASLVLFYL
jgi:hypothetical protein